MYSKETNKVDEFMKQQKPYNGVCEVREMAQSFLETAEMLGVYITMNPYSLHIDSVHVTSQSGLKRLMIALDTVYVELLGSGLEVDDVLPLVILTEEYFKALKKVAARIQWRLN